MDIILIQKKTKSVNVNNNKPSKETERYLS